MQSLDEVIDDELSRYTGPVLLYDRRILGANMGALAEAVRPTDWPMLAVKSFPHPVVTEMAKQHRLGFEVSNLAEYQLLPNDLSGSNVSLGRATPVPPEPFTERGNRLTINTERYTAPNAHPSVRHGLRLNFRDIPGVPDAERLAFDRFGASWEEFADRLRSGAAVDGAHFHNASEVNSADSYLVALRAIRDLADAVGAPLEFINVGGGLHGVPASVRPGLLRQLTVEAGPRELHIEPGNALCDGAGHLLCRVEWVREWEKGCYYVGLDASYDCHAQWNYPSWVSLPGLPCEALPYRQLPSAAEGKHTIVFSGASCYNSDRLGVFRFDADGDVFPLSPGDPVVFADMNGYAWAWTVGFNGIPPADIRFYDSAAPSPG